MDKIPFGEVARLVTALRENADEKENVTFRTHALNHKAADVLEQLSTENINLRTSVTKLIQELCDES